MGSYPVRYPVGTAAACCLLLLRKSWLATERSEVNSRSSMPAEWEWLSVFFHSPVASSSRSEYRSVLLAAAAEEELVGD